MAFQTTVISQTIKFDDKAGDLKGLTVTLGDGNAVCYCGKFGWCDDLVPIIEQGLDQLGKLMADNFEGSFSLPFIPSRDLWVPIRFKSISRDMFEASVIILDSPSFEGLVDRFLGILTLEDTRATVRSMLVHWFGQFRPLVQGMLCAAPTHGMKEIRKMDIAVKLKDETYLLANDWSIYWYRACRPCYERTKAISDLVPDDERTSPFRR